MADGEGRRGPGQAGDRPIVYCLVPPELAGKLHDPLRAHFREDPGVEVVVDLRIGDRRRGERRRLDAGPPPEGERRQIRSASGRRVAERRAELTPVPAPALPRRARRYAQRLAFVERREPSTLHAEDDDTARCVARYQGGDVEAFNVLYTRYFDRVYGYLRIALRDRHEAEDATQQVFTSVFEALPRYEQRGSPFRAWLFTVVRNCAVDLLVERGRIEVTDEVEVEDRQVAEPGEPVPSALSWISDPDLTRFIERLPLPQRQVVVMRFMLDLSHRQISQVLDLREDNVRALQYRALGFLRTRLEAIGRGPRHNPRSRMRTPTNKANVLRARRFALFG